MYRRINESYRQLPYCASFANAIVHLQGEPCRGYSCITRGNSMAKGENIWADIKKSLGVVGTVTRENS